MLRMIIADDEKVIRETIQSLIDWTALDIEIVGLCKNGLEAYDMILDENPDIVLTDIRMPGLSGLDLIQQIRQVSPEVQFIILSGYNDFAYAKKAMEYGVQFYLLKPCNESEIIEAIEMAKKGCRQRAYRKEQQQDKLLTLKQLYESVILQLLHEPLLQQSDFEALQEKYENRLDFENVGYEICCFQNISSPEQRAIYQKFMQFHVEYAPYAPTYCVQFEQSLLIGFESYDYTYALLDETMQRNMPQAECYARIAQPSLREMLLFLQQKMKNKSGVQIGFGTKQLSVNDGTDSTLQPPVDACIAQIEKIVRENIADSELSLKKISEQYLYMNVDYLSRKFSKVRGQKFSAFLANERITVAKQLFQEKMSSVNAVAEQVGCGNNPQYFSQLFKKHTGITPSEYLKNL